MAQKHLLFDEDARRALERGVNTLAGAVKVTPGWSVVCAPKLREVRTMRAKKTTRRTRLLLAVAVILGALLTAAPALAVVCGVPNKPQGAGATVDATGEEPTPNAGGQLKGGFVTFEEGGQLFDVFLLPVTPALEAPFEEVPVGELPDGAHNAGPGDDLCDGIGIDDFEACLFP